MKHSALFLSTAAMCACVQTEIDPTSQQTFTLTATWIDTYVTESGTFDVPKNLEGTDIVAVSSFDQREYPAVGRSDGHLTISDLPEAPYALRFDMVAGGPIYLAGDAHAVDLGQAILGRPDVVLPRSIDTAIDVHLEGLAPWDTNDDLELYSFDASIVAAISFYARPPLDVGATSFERTLEWDGELSYTPNLIDADATYVLQLTHHTQADGDTIWSLDRFAAMAPFSIIDGQTNIIRGSLEPAALNLEATIDWRRADFVRTTLPTEQYVELGTLPRTTDFPLGQWMPLFRRSSMGSTNLAETRVLANPLPASFPIIAYARASFIAPTSIDGAPPLNIGVYTESFVELEPGRSVEPVVGLPSDVRFNGGTELSDVGTTPVISWSPPSQGPADGYLLSIGSLSVVDGRTKRTFVARVLTEKSSVQIPPGVLKEGETYAIRLSAMRHGGRGINGAPYRARLPYGYSELLIPNVSP